MTKKKTPAADVPACLKPGYKFSIDWPPKFKPQPYTPTREFTPQMRENLRKGTKAQNKRIEGAGEGIHAKEFLE